MDPTGSEPQFRIPTPPPLRNHDRNHYVPLRVFAFPLSDDHLAQWAKKNMTSSSKSNYNLAQDAWMEIARRRPRVGWCRSAIVHYGDGDAGLAIVIASNKSTKHMAQAEDINLIQQYRDLLHIDPGWFRMFRSGG